MSDVLEERLRIALAAERARDDVRAARARAAALGALPRPANHARRVAVTHQGLTLITGDTRRHVYPYGRPAPGAPRPPAGGPPHP